MEPISGPPAASMSSDTVRRCSCSRECWNVRPTEPTWRAIGLPSNNAVPDVGTVNPAMIQASVDFPEPLPPSTNTPSPEPMVRLTSDNAVRDHGVRLL